MGERDTIEARIKQLRAAIDSANLSHRQTIAKFETEIAALEAVQADPIKMLQHQLQIANARISELEANRLIQPVRPLEFPDLPRWPFGPPVW